jgi:hypothetical protein
MDSVTDLASDEATIVKDYLYLSIKPFSHQEIITSLDVSKLNLSQKHSEKDYQYSLSQGASKQDHIPYLYLNSSEFDLE